jgi:hypothetical protein
MSRAGPAAALYFVSLNIIGTYLILNLFIAILLSNFDSQHRFVRASSRLPVVVLGCRPGVWVEATLCCWSVLQSGRDRPARRAIRNAVRLVGILK